MAGVFIVFNAIEDAHLCTNKLFQIDCMPLAIVDTLHVDINRLKARHNHWLYFFLSNSL